MSDDNNTLAWRSCLEGFLIKHVMKERIAAKRAVYVRGHVVAICLDGACRTQMDLCCPEFMCCL